MTASDYVALFARTQDKAESQVHSQKQAAGRIGLHLNANKTESMTLNEIGDIQL